MPQPATGHQREFRVSKDNEANGNGDHGTGAGSDILVLRALLRFRQVMGRLLLLMLGLVGLAFAGLHRGTARWAVELVLAGAALAALGMLLVPLWLAWTLRKRS